MNLKSPETSKKTQLTNLLILFWPGSSLSPSAIWGNRTRSERSMTARGDVIATYATNLVRLMRKGDSMRLLSCSQRDITAENRDIA